MSHRCRDQWHAVINDIDFDDGDRAGVWNVDS